MKNKDILDKKTYEHKKKWHDNSGYVPKKINWKKTTIVLSILTLIVTGVIFIWGYGLGGFKFLNLKEFVSNFYKDIYVSRDENKIKNYSFCDQKSEDNTKKNVSKMKENNWKFSGEFVVEVKKKHNNSYYDFAVTDRDFKKPEKGKLLTGPVVFIGAKEIKGKNTICNIEYIWTNDSFIKK